MMANGSGARSLYLFVCWCVYRTLGTPNEKTWPGVTSLPDYKTTFPNWPGHQLLNVMKGIDSAGVDLLEVRHLLLVGVSPGSC